MTLLLCCCSIAQSCPTLCDPMECSTPELPQTHVHLIKSVMPSNHLILFHPLFLTSIFLSISVFFQWIGSLHQVAKVLKLQFQHQSSSEYSELISSKIDWFDLAVHGTLKSLLQHHGSKASILWLSAFFMVQLSHPYMTTGKTIALTIWTVLTK